jgi:two-component system phosphate regulon response regulator PhoB
MPVVALPRILYTEDEPQLRNLVSAMLANQGFEVKAVSNGAEALAMVKGWLPDLFLLDISMPNMSGIELLKRLKSDPQTRKTPVIFLSGQCVRNGEKHGANHVIAKPFSPLELEALVRDCVFGNGTPDPGHKAPKVVVETGTLWIGNSHWNLNPLETELMSFFIRHAGEGFSSIALANHLRQKGLAGRTPEDVHAVVLSLAAKLDDSLDLEVFLQYTRGGWIYHA